MSELFAAFAAGNAAILTNSCLLPLYPGLIAFLAGSAGNERSRRATVWLGLLVLAGILTMMALIGLLLYLLSAAAGDVFPLLLPLVYGLVILLGLGMLAGYNPFARLSTAQAPLLRSPYLTAYIYGLFFGPMTLPCTGPIIVGAFAFSAGSLSNLADGLLYFLVFGLGFGWPLALLPLAALPLQRRLVGWLTLHHGALTRGSGVLLLGVGLFGILTELLPQATGFVLPEEGQLVYWLLVFVLALAVGYGVYRTHHPPGKSSAAG